MEPVYTTIQNLQLDLFQVFISGLFLFFTGFWIGRVKSRKLERKMAKMEKEIRDLNAELLYGDQPASLLKIHR